MRQHSCLEIGVSQIPAVQSCADRHVTLGSSAMGSSANPITSVKSMIKRSLAEKATHTLAERNLGAIVAQMENLCKFQSTST